MPRPARDEQWWCPDPGDVWLTMADLRRVFLVSGDAIRRWIDVHGFPSPMISGVNAPVGLGRGDQWRYSHVREWIQGYGQEFMDYVHMLDAITGMDGSRVYSLRYRVVGDPAWTGVHYTFRVELSHELLDELRERHSQGWSTRDLGCEFGLSRHMIEWIVGGTRTNRNFHGRIRARM